MAMDHSNCAHPRTPAGRAACRKAGGPGAAAGSTPNPPKTAKKAAATPTPTGTTRTTPKASSAALKRPGTRIKGTADMADVPAVFAPAIKTAQAGGHVVRAGEPYNELERRVEVFGPRGVVHLIWLASNPSGVNDVQFRPADSSVTSRQPSVNEALRVAGIAA